MAWVYLVVAGLFEIGWAIGLKASDGLTRPGSTIATAVALVVSMFLLAQAVRTIPIGTGYAIWTGIGAAGTAMVGMIAFAEPASAGRLVSLAAIVFGIVGLKLSS
jgi:quaternary ammonium compound-resistance protein SugE